MPDQVQQYEEIDANTGQAGLEGFDFAKLLFVVRASIVWILLIFALCVASVWVYERYTKELYESRAVIKLGLQNSSGLLNIDIEPLGDASSYNLAGEVRLINSRVIYDAVIDSLDLRVSFFSQGDLLSSEVYGSSAPFRLEYDSERFAYRDRPVYFQALSEERYALRYRTEQGEFSEEYFFGEKVERPEMSFTLTLKEGVRVESMQVFYFVVNSDNALYGYFGNNLQVGVENASAGTMSIGLIDHNRQKAKEIVDAIVALYFEKTIESKNAAFEKQLAYMRRQLVYTKDSVDKYERIVTRLGPARPMDVSQEGVEARLVEEREKSLESYERLVERLEENRVERLIERNAYRTIGDLLEEDADSTVIFAQLLAEELDNSVLRDLLGELLLARAAWLRVETAYKPTSEAWQQKRQTVGKAEERTADLVRFSVEMIDAEVDSLDRRLSEVEAERDRIAAYEPDNAYKQALRAYRSYEKIFEIYQQKIIEFQIIVNSTVPNSQVLSPGSMPTVPVYPVKAVIYGIAGSAGAFFSFLLIAIRYLLLNKVNNLREVNRLTGVPVLGAVPRYIKRRLEHSQLVVHQSPKAAISEALRSIRTNMEFMLGDKAGKSRVLSVTSTISGEGKTFLAVNLAGVIAMPGQRVVLLDLDMRRPKVHLAFSQMNEVGVSSLLVGKSGLDDVLMKTDIDTFDFIPSGPIPPNPSELLMSKKFEELLEQLKERYDVVMMDTPPVGIVTDGVLTMRYSDLPIYVLRANYSRLSFIQNVNALYGEKGFSNLSLVLNDVSANNTYGYGYGYGYGYNNYGYGYGNYGRYGARGYGYYYDDEEGYYEEDTVIRRRKGLFKAVLRQIVFGKRKPRK